MAEQNETEAKMAQCTVEGDTPEAKRDKYISEYNTCQAQTNSPNADREDVEGKGDSTSTDEKGKREAKEDNCKVEGDQARAAWNISVTESNTSQAQVDKRATERSNPQDEERQSQGETGSEENKNKSEAESKIPGGEENNLEGDQGKVKEDGYKVEGGKPDAKED
jgi:hypothetical protein